MYSKIEKFILDDLKIHEGQNSWDWSADYRFAKAIGDEVSAETIRMVINSGAPAPLREGVVKSTKIAKKRMRILRNLIKKDMVIATWIGLGYGSKCSFGVNRVRDYRLTPSRTS